LNIRAAHWANHVRPQRWAKKPSQQERKKKKKSPNYIAVVNVDLMFLETSALNGENVEEAFLKCTRTILAKIESGKSSLCELVNG